MLHYGIISGTDIEEKYSGLYALSRLTTYILGVIDDESISEIVGLPEEKTVAALIVYGYENGPPAPRKDVDDIMRFVRV